MTVDGDEVYKYRFAYRMRVENLANNANTVQLLGRTWRIQDTDSQGEPIGEPQHVHAPTTGVGALSSWGSVRLHARYRYRAYSFLTLSSLTFIDVVGHLPVLHAGDVFEYMSGCELFAEKGTMSGSFHMAEVPDKIRSAIVGDPNVDALKEENPNVFEMPIHEFSLVASDD